MDPLTTLVTAAKGGDKDAFGHIVHRFQDMAYATAYTRLGDPYQAQDAAQDAFIDAYTLLNDLREPASFPGWFRRIVLKHNRAMVEQLLNHNASATLKDKRGCTPADWAAIQGFDDLVDCLGGAQKPAASLQSKAKSTSAPKKRTVPPASAALGRILNANGEPIDDLGPLPDATPEPLHRSISDLPSPILETGIKIIDLFAPLKRGGQVAIFTPLTGVGRRLLLGQLITSMAIRHNGCIVYLGLEDDTYKPRELILEWQAEFGMDHRVVREQMVHLFAHANDSIAQKQRVVETGLSFAEHLRRQGNEVLLVLENPLALTEGVIPYLKAHTSCTPESAITTLYDADHTPGAEPRAYAHLDAIITFNMDRAQEGLYPAIDPLESRSALLLSELIDPNQIELVAEIKRLFKRYQGLHYQYEYRRSDGLFYLDDPKAGEQIAIRARRLHRFLTQPYHGGEPWTGIPGVWVSLEETLQGCREILEGKHDDLPENAFKFIGTIDQVDATAEEINQSVEKAGRGRG